MEHGAEKASRPHSRVFGLGLAVAGKEKKKKRKDYSSQTVRI